MEFRAPSASGAAMSPHVLPSPHLPGGVRLSLHPDFGVPRLDLPAADRECGAACHGPGNATAAGSADSGIGYCVMRPGLFQMGPGESMARPGGGSGEIDHCPHLFARVSATCLIGDFPSFMFCGGSRSGSRASNAWLSRKSLRRDRPLRNPGRTDTANSVVSWSQVRSGYAAGMDTAELPGQHMAASPYGVSANMPCRPRHNIMRRLDHKCITFCSPHGEIAVWPAVRYTLGLLAF